MNTMKFDKNIASIPARTVSGSFVVSIAAAIIISLIIIAISMIARLGFLCMNNHVFTEIFT